MILKPRLPGLRLATRLVKIVLGFLVSVVLHTKELILASMIKHGLLKKDEQCRPFQSMREVLCCQS